MSTNTLGDLVKQLVRNLWWIIVLAIICAAGMFFFSKQQPSNTEGAYRTARLMYIQNSTNKLADPASRHEADVKSIQGYVEAENNQVIVRETLAILKKQGITSISYDEARNNTKLVQKHGTVAVWANATADSEKEAVALTNAFAEAFAMEATKLIPDMPQPVLMPATGGAALSEDYVAPLSPKKAAIYGAGAGLIIGVILSLFFGVIGNYRRLRRQ